MLKIKECVDLKELEKYGLYNVTLSTNNIYIKKGYTIIINLIGDRAIITSNKPSLDDTLYDLIIAGLVEKVDD